MQQEIRLATFNVRNLALPGTICYPDLPPCTPAEYEAKIAWIAGLTDRFCPDVIAFEEIFSEQRPSQTSWLARNDCAMPSLSIPKFRPNLPDPPRKLHSSHDYRWPPHRKHTPAFPKISGYRYREAIPPSIVFHVPYWKLPFCYLTARRSISMPCISNPNALILFRIPCFQTLSNMGWPCFGRLPDVQPTRSASIHSSHDSGKKQENRLYCWEILTTHPTPSRLVSPLAYNMQVSRHFHHCIVFTMHWIFSRHLLAYRKTTVPPCIRIPDTSTISSYQTNLRKRPDINPDMSSIRFT